MKLLKKEGLCKGIVMNNINVNEEYMFASDIFTDFYKSLKFNYIKYFQMDQNNKIPPIDFLEDLIALKTSEIFIFLTQDDDIDIQIKRNQVKNYFEVVKRKIEISEFNTSLEDVEHIFYTNLNINLNKRMECFKNSLNNQLNFSISDRIAIKREESELDNFNGQKQIRSNKIK